MDKITKSQRSRNMSRIRSHGSRAERIVRSEAHGLGFRYRLHVSGLPGKPDMVFRRKSKVIFVHGCFWHQHAGCKLASVPKTNENYWWPKLKRNMQRDEENIRRLQEEGWDVLIVWECETRDRAAVREKVKLFLAGEWA